MTGSIGSRSRSPRTFARRSGVASESCSGSIPTSGALHSLGIDGQVIPGEVVPAVRRGQVLPPGSCCAGHAVALGRTFIASTYAPDYIVVPRIMAEAVASLPALTTMSSPLMFRRRIVGALTVGRIRTSRSVDYSKDDVRLADQLARAAAPLLARAQRIAEHDRRQRGASALSRLAGSLTQSLSVAAVADQLTRSAVTLVGGDSAATWSAQGEPARDDRGRAVVLREAKDPRLEHILEEVSRTRQPFWTPDLAHDPRLALPLGSSVKEPDGPRAVLVVPIRIRETLLGLFGIAGDTGRAFTPADVEFVQALVDQAALGIANARAHNELQVSNIELLRHEKLVAMGRLSSGLAHEIRNPPEHRRADVRTSRTRARERS
jgi:GAF domain-containing protein